MVAQPQTRLPSPLELPCSDDTPVDNEDQNLLPNLLLFVLASLWSERMDWYFGVDMAVYHTTGVNPRVPVVPDAFLSLGVKRWVGSANPSTAAVQASDISQAKDEASKVSEPDGYSRGRLSYAVWHEGGVVPTLALEMVSKTPGGEYDEKLEIYQRLGVLYYVLYNPEHWERDRHLPFEVYKLIDGKYRQQVGEPYWMPEVGLGIGRGVQPVGGIKRNVLQWHDQQGQAYPVPEAEIRRLQAQLSQLQQQTEAADQRADVEQRRAEAERQKAEAERQRAERLAAYVRSLGIDPTNLPEES